MCETPLRRLVFRIGEGALDQSGHAVLLLNEDDGIEGANEAALSALGAGWDLIGTPLGQWLDGPLRAEDSLLNSPGGSVFTGRIHSPSMTRPLSSLPSGADVRLGPFIPAELDAQALPLLQRATRALDAGLAILLQGETGSGKEVMARHIHAQSRWHGGDFVAINCAAMPEHLIESELFGYGPGAFTGARREGARGLLRQAHQGVLFLDEIGDMPLSLQTRLLRVLQERVVQPLGTEKRIPVDFGLISASHRDLETLVAEGAFRMDLYYRLQDLPLRLPPLRDRSDLQSFIAQVYRKLGGRLGPDAVAVLADYDWPGNYRELRSLLLRVRCENPGGAALTVRQLPADFGRCRLPVPQVGEPAPDRAGHEPAARVQSTLQSLEDAAIGRALEECSGNVGRAAARLGIHRSTLYRKLVHRQGIPKT
ncbi:Transcriptional regulator of acetoin/glycerol metabolism OS=Castellaniella defragrans OX=75697 GN=HNR28_001909 PE=4 SV=1 [Castellaniella defragrans]